MTENIDVVQKLTKLYKCINIWAHKLILVTWTHIRAFFYS